MWGSRTALVTVVEFADFQCPFCARAEATLAKARQDYGPGDLRIVYKHLPLPFHPHARPAAEAAQGVFALGGNDAFWRFYAKAYAGQEALPDTYDGWASAAGVDTGAFRDGMRAHRWADAVDHDAALGEKLHVEGTPTFFINGVRIEGAVPATRFEAVVDDVIVQAKAALDHGAPRDRLYVLTSTYNVKHQPPPDDEPEAPDAAAHRVAVGSSPVRGPATAPVTIVEFADFQCPYCGRAEETLQKVRETYGDRVRVVWKNEPLPFHARAEPAAEVAYEARAERGDAGFWDVHDRILAQQSKIEDVDLLDVARAAKLDLDRVKKAMAAHKYKQFLDDDSDAADDLKANGTPHFFINGHRLVGAQPFEEFQKIIDAQEVAARAVTAKGVAPRDVYDELMKQAEPPGPEKKSVAVPAVAPSRGPAAAPVVIQEFADFQCPFCSRAEGALSEVLKAYPGKVRVVWRNLPLPFHENAEPAAEAALEAFSEKGNDGFWKMHDLLYSSQGANGGLARPALERYAHETGLDAVKFAAALDTKAHQAEIDQDKKSASDAALNGTPTFVINGYVLGGAQPFPAFRRLVDRALQDRAGARP